MKRWLLVAMLFAASIVVVMAATVAADTVLFEQGTGATCAGAPTALTPTFSSGVLTTGATVVSIGAFKTAASNGLCAVTTVGTGPSIGVMVTYIQQ